MLPSVLAFLGCSLSLTPIQGSSVDQDSPVPLATATSSPAIPTLSQGATYLGQIAAVGQDGNLYRLSSGIDHPEPITTDAVQQADPFLARIYLHPTWSRDGWLSYMRGEISEEIGSSLEVYAVHPQSSHPIRVLRSVTDSYVYGFWSPQECPTTPDCGRFAFLMGEDGQVALHLAEVNSESQTPLSEGTLETADSLYYSWSTDGSTMLWFENQSRLSLYEVESATRSDLEMEPYGLFQAPSWSPSAEQFLFARSAGGANDLALGGALDDIIASQLDGFVFFGWSPDGKRVAYAHGAYPLSPVTVAGQEDWDNSAVSTVGNVVAFFWSPDSTKIAIVASEHDAGPIAAIRSAAVANSASGFQPVMQPGTSTLVWYVMDALSGQTTRLASFIPSSDQLYVIQFFDQYAQSHRVWSPDSRFLVYSHIAEDSGDPIISLVDTEIVGQSPVKLMDGRIAVFSFN